MQNAAVKIAAQWEQVKQQLPRQEIVGWVRGQLGRESVRALGEVLGAVLQGQVDEMLGRGRREGVRSQQLQEEGELVCGRCGEGRGVGNMDCGSDWSGSVGIGRSWSWPGYSGVRCGGGGSG